MKKPLLLIALLLSIFNAYGIPIYTNIQAEVFSASGPNNAYGYNIGDEVNYYFLVDRDLPGTRTLGDGSVTEVQPIGPGNDVFFVDFLMGDMLPVSDIPIGPTMIAEYNNGSENLFSNTGLDYWFGSLNNHLRMSFYRTGGFDGGAYWIIEHLQFLSNDERVYVSAYADADSVTVSDTPFPTVPEPAAWLLLLIGIFMLGMQRFLQRVRFSHA